MSAWAWTDCRKCGDLVHTGFMCGCGGDPWGIKIDAKNKLKDVNDKIDKLKNELQGLIGVKNSLNKIIEK